MKILFFSFIMAIKTAGSAQKIWVGRVSGNTAISFGGRPYLKLHKINAGVLILSWYIKAIIRTTSLRTQSW